jgi:cell wall-associated NlpC family hydrolase
MKSKELIEYAKKFLGIPYKFGGTSPSTGFDCSGFVQYVYKNCLGINISRTTKEQINDGFEVKKEDLYQEI